MALLHPIFMYFCATPFHGIFLLISVKRGDASVVLQGQLHLKSQPDSVLVIQAYWVRHVRLNLICAKSDSRQCYCTDWQTPCTTLQSTLHTHTQAVAFQVIMFIILHKID
jgi:hypothetical protein